MSYRIVSLSCSRHDNVRANRGRNTSHNNQPHQDDRIDRFCSRSGYRHYNAKDERRECLDIISTEDLKGENVPDRISLEQ
jgi:hypothetical protein